MRPWYVRNSDVLHDQRLVATEIKPFVAIREARFHQHINVEAFQALGKKNEHE